jgi:hypothetical protein
MSDLDNEENFEKIVTDQAVVYRTKNYPGPIAIDATPSKECDEYHKNSQIQIMQWVGTARCFTYDGRILKMADEFNRIENEKRL